MFLVEISFIVLPKFPVGDIALTIIIHSNCYHSSICLYPNSITVSCRNRHNVCPKNDIALTKQRFFSNANHGSVRF